MPRETKELKAQRYLVEARLVLRHVTPRQILAQVRGNGRIYEVSWRPGEWSCTCPNEARYADCSHIVAVKRVTTTDVEVAR